tara:strand:+ start:44 stop:790 length:747 start_codon:yes stop_codon:yes gene_type:complete
MTEKFTFFDKHPEYYEQGFGDKKVNQQVKFLDKIFKENKVKKVLDIACGHTPQGRKLAKKGYKVSGIDLSSSLLKLAKKRAEQENVKLNLYKKDMSKFKVGKFDATYILFSSILHLYKSKELLSHFISVNKNLKKGGLYIIDLSDLPYEDPFKSAVFDKKKGGLRTHIIYNPIGSSKQTAKFTCSSFLKRKKVNEDSFIVLKNIPLISLKKLAKKTGFDIKNIYKDFTFSKKLNVKKPEYIAILKKIK